MVDGVCMARKNAKNQHLRCEREVYKNTDFCRYHVGYKVYHKPTLDKIKKKFAIDKERLVTHTTVKYFNKKLTDFNTVLDKKYDYNLLGLIDSWEDVPLYRRIMVGGKMHDIKILTNHFTNQINSCLMENPLPVYPSDPFTKIMFTPEDLVKIEGRLNRFKIKVNPSVSYFLSSNTSNYYAEAAKNYNQTCTNFIARLQKKFRYRLLNYKNSQESYIGMWVDKHQPLSDFELIYREYTDAPFQIVDYFGYVVGNPRKQHLKSVLDSLKPEEWIID